jgi:hypothetical protein
VLDGSDRALLGRVQSEKAIFTFANVEGFVFGASGVRSALEGTYVLAGPFLAHVAVGHCIVADAANRGTRVGLPEGITSLPSGAQQG